MSDYTIDWSNTNIDGNNTATSGSGDVGFSVSTPENVNHDQWMVGTVGGTDGLKAWDVNCPTKVNVNFDEAVENVTFELLDVDSGSNWDDRITIIAKDAHGNEVPVQFSDLASHHHVNGTQLDTTGNVNPGVDGSGAEDSVTVTIAGPIVSLQIIYDNGSGASLSGTVGLSNIGFDAVAPVGDGIVDGTSGNDTIDVSYVGDPEGDKIDNNDALLPGEAPQDDIVVAGDGNDFVLAGDGNDEVYGRDGDDTLCGQDGEDVLYGGAGTDILEGMNGDDVLLGEAGNDSLYGDAGSDVMSGGTGDDKILGGAGEDLASGGKGDDTINVGGDDDVAYGGAGADSILGGGGNDTLIGGNMTFDGTQDFNDLATGELIDGQFIGEGVTITSGDPEHPVMVFDTANPTGGDNDLATTNLGKVLILSEDRDGTDPDDNGSGGTFFINFEAPADVTSLTLLDVDGGANVKYYDSDGNLLHEVDVTTADNGQFVVSTDLQMVASIEITLGNSGAIDNLTYAIDPDTMDGDDVISGGAGDDYIEGNAGNDDLSGDGGDDTVYGGDGDDDIFGGSGEDFLLGGDGDDTIEGGDDDDTLCGNDGDDVLFGGAGNDILEGMNNDDVLFGGTGADTLYGDSGDDELTGGEGDDLIKGGSGSDTIFGGAGDSVFGGATGSDHDILDLTGQGPFYLDNVVSDTETGGNGNGINGTVVFVDGDGNPTGETLTFVDIEEIIGEEVNRGPDAQDDTATVDEDGSVDINVLGNDTDPDGDDLEVTEATSPDGDVTINADGTITFEPDENFNGETTITYTISDGNGGTDTATVTVTVNPVNDDPVAVADTGETDEDTVLTLDNVLGNDTDVDGDDLTVGDVNGEAANVGEPVEGDNGGTFTINEDGTATFDPSGDFESLGDGETQETSVTYTVSDGNGGTNTTTVTVTVTGVNDGPVAVDSAYVVDQSEAFGDVDANAITDDTGDGVDSDPEGDDLTVVAVDGEAGNVGGVVAGDNGGEFTIGADGTVDFNANGDFDELGEGETASTTVTYTIADEDGLEDTATVTFTVTGTNDGPVAVEDAFDATEDDPSDVVGNVLDNDEDLDGDPLTVSEVNGDPANVGEPIEGSNGGLITINEDGAVTFDPNGEFEDLDEGEETTTTVTYTVTDPDGSEATATVTITVTGTNDEPIAVADTDSTDQDTSIVLDNVLGNDTDPEDDPLAVSEVNGDPANVGEPIAGDNGGLITVNEDGSASFDPNGEFDALGEGETAETQVTYTIVDDNGATDTTTVTITVTGTNDAPIAVADVDETDQDTSIVLENVLGNDSDVDGDPLTVSEVNGDSADVGEPVVGDNGGLITINEDGTASFDPNGDFDALDVGETAETQVTYTITDPEGGTDTTTVTITVTGTNDAPTAVADTDGTDQDTSIVLDNVLGNDTDPEDDPLTVSEVNGDPANVGEPVTGDNGGTFTINDDGTATFDPAGDFDDLAIGETETTEITYTIVDDNGLTDTTTVTVTVSGGNDGPVAVADTGETDEDNPVVLDNVLGNDTDPDGDDLTVGDVNGDPANVGEPVEGDNGGTFTINEDGTATFDPSGDFEGLGEGETEETSVTYTVVDEDGLEDTATVTFTVTGTNDGPVATPDTDETDEDTVITLDNVLGNDVDPDAGDVLTVSEVNGDPANVGEPIAGDNGGLITINEDGTASFDPNGEFEELSPGESVETTVTYTVTDENGEEDTTTVTITVNGVNDGPDATDNAYVVSLSETSGDVDGNVITDDTGDGVDSDPEGDNLTVSAVDGDPANVGEAVAGDNGGLFTINPDGTVDFDANGDFDDLGLGETADTSVTYTIVDENGAEDTATATFTVTGINDGTVQGTSGNDVINPDIPYVDADGDIVDAGDGILPGDEGTDNDVIEGFEGDDIIQAGEGDDAVFGGADDDSITGNGGDDELFGGDGDDTVRGGTGDDTLSGDDGMDMLFGGAGDDTLDGGDGDDKIEGGSGDDTIIGGEGNDDLWGASGDDSVDGGAGDDTIATAEGNDIVEGGDGDDIIDTSNDENPFTTDPGQNLPDIGYPGLYPADLDPNDDLDTVFGGAGDDSILTGDDDDTIFGGTGNDTIDAGVDDDFVEGGDGNDTIIGSEGNDEIYGEDGDDTIFGGLVPGGPGDVLNLPDDLDGDGDSNDPGEDLVTDNNNDTLFGGAGNDTIFGADDDDTLFGGTGDDVLDGGVDDDVLEGGDGDDTVIGGQGDDVLSGDDGDDDLSGDDGNDLVFGGIGDDVIDGGAGDDELSGGEGDDTVTGGDGDDVIFGEDGNDDLQGGDGDDFIFGDDGNDVITGGDGEDVLSGDFGSDTFLGGNGGDVVVGGEDDDDSDVDVLDLTGSNVDFITYVDGDPEAGEVTFLDGSTMTFSEIENVIPCFTPGTAIATPKGERLVEELREGDRIITRDNGIQEIRWVGRKEMSGKALVANPHLKPILVRAGSLGNGLPERDMLVSPNHRMLVASDKTQLYFEEREVLAAAKHLVGSDGIHAVDVMGTAYIHFMFDRHEVVLSNGAWTESFQPGDYSLKGIGNSQRNEIFELFPELQSKTGLEGYQSARRALKKHEARLLVK